MCGAAEVDLGDRGKQKHKATLSVVSSRIISSLVQSLLFQGLFVHKSISWSVDQLSAANSPQSMAHHITARHA